MLLIDECIDRRFRFRAKTKQKAIRSLKVLGAGTPDDEIAKYAEEHNAFVMTADIGFAKNQLLIRKRDVYFVVRNDGSLFHIRVRRIGTLKHKRDKITQYVRDTYGSGIIRP